MNARQLTLIITRSLAQEPACKDLGRNGQKRAITPKAAYTPAPNRASSRSEGEEIHDFNRHFKPLNRRFLPTRTS
ncbi:Malolactic regulator [Lacticaseibacillus casei]|nr:Malolactic regulator [Lacticaseibacillus casei]